MIVTFYNECDLMGNLIESDATLIKKVDRVHVFRSYVDLITGDDIEHLELNVASQAFFVGDKAWADFSISND